MTKLITAIINHTNVGISYLLILFLLAGGIYFTIRTRLAPLRLLKEQLRSLTERPKGGRGASSFQALMISTASRVGTGNIVGVSTAICTGGYGSVFWMWLIALIGAASALIESTLAQIFKKRSIHGCYGGPAYYIEATFKSRVPALIFTFFLILTYGIGFNMLASYNLQDTFSGYSFYNAGYTPWIVGGILALLVFYCLMGGGKRVLRLTELAVPPMGILYVLVALIVVGTNLPALPAILRRIFTDAFDFKAIFGGFSGSCLMFGIKRGLFSNEAGVGSAPNAAAAAEVSHPVKQGLVQVLSVFIDTLLICSATAFMCLASGVAPSEALSGAPYVQMALTTALGQFGPIFITAAMILFAFTTLLGNLYYVEQGLYYIFKRIPSKPFLTIYRILASLLILIGAGLSADLLWNIADIAMACMALINIPVICYLGRYAVAALKDYEAKRRQGKEPTFYADQIGLPYKTDYWNQSED